MSQLEGCILAGLGVVAYRLLLLVLQG